MAEDKMTESDKGLQANLNQAERVDALRRVSDILENSRGTQDPTKPFVISVDLTTTPEALKDRAIEPRSYRIKLAEAES